MKTLYKKNRKARYLFDMYIVYLLNHRARPNEDACSVLHCHPTTWIEDGLTEKLCPTTDFVACYSLATRKAKLKNIKRGIEWPPKKAWSSEFNIDEVLIYFRKGTCSGKRCSMLYHGTL